MRRRWRDSSLIGHAQFSVTLRYERGGERVTCLRINPIIRHSTIKALYYFAPTPEVKPYKLQFTIRKRSSAEERGESTDVRYPFCQLVSSPPPVGLADDS